MITLRVVLTLTLSVLTQLTTASGAHRESYCQSYEFPIMKIIDTEICPIQVSEKENTAGIIVDSVPVVDLTSFVRHPTNGQRLILVPRDSDLSIVLDDHVAYQLRQRQQLHSVSSDDLMDIGAMPMNGIKILSPLSDEVIRQLKQQHNSNQTNNQNFVEQEFPPTDVVPLLLKSHPGQALVPLQSNTINGGFMMEQIDYIDIGIGSESDAINIRLREPQKVSKKGDSSDDTFRYSLINGDGLVFMVGSSHLTIGSPVTMTSWLKTADDADGADVMLSYFATDFDYRGAFIVNHDGSLSPYEAQHLVVGISRFPPVTLMERFSPNRLIFQDADTFWKPPAPVNGTALVLKSHPGLAVVSYPRYRGAFGMADVMDILIGPANNDTYRAFHIFPRDSLRHHQFSLRDKYGAYLIPMNLKLEHDVPIRMIKYNITQSTVVNIAMTLHLSVVRNATWTINLEGSISPLDAPHLVLGCNYASAFVDREVATRNRLLSQSNVISNNDATDSNINDISKTVGNESRILHGIVWFLFPEDHFRHVAFVLLVVILVAIKLVPLPVWMMLVIYFTLGVTACVFYAGYHISYLMTSAMFKRLKKRNVPDVLQVARR